MHSGVKYKDNVVLLSEDLSKPKIYHDHLNNNDRYFLGPFCTFKVQNAVARLGGLQTGHCSCWGTAE